VIDLKIAPNPVTGSIAKISFKITDKRNLKISIHDISGREIMILAENDFHYEGEYSIDADLSDLPGGMYLIAITTDKGEQAVSRVIVAR
ncbi:MAG: T9SS type A sorting domain-containing protein, partial [Chlorobi bacterium]|nr:T9SS type A sorting domain-containing protein [Chlorobiota bacterium]